MSQTSSSSLSSSSASAAALSSSSSSSVPPTRTSSSTSITKMADLSHIIPPPRATRIRFAPLPDPRRAVLVTEDGLELPLPPSELAAIALESPDSSPNASLAASPIILCSPLPPSEQPEKTAPPTKKSKSWLSSFMRTKSSSSSSSPSSSTHTHSRTPSPLPVPVDPSAVTISLIRSTSIESTASTSHPSFLGGLGLQRLSSTTPSTTSPLARTFSAQSANLPSAKKKRHTTTATAHAHATAGGGLHLHRGTRMLNGRVYGAPKKNPFDNVRDEEPTFVEWGYGGMGSNKSTTGGSSGTDWGRVQGNNSEKENTCSVVAASRDEDDGSGMAWVKKRREEREQEKKAKEAAAAAAAATAAAAASVSTTVTATAIIDEPKEGVGVVTPIPEEEDGEEDDGNQKSEEHTPTPSRQATLALSPLLETPVSPTHMEQQQQQQQQYVLQAVNVTNREASPDDDEDSDGDNNEEEDDDEDEEDEEDDDDEEAMKHRAQVMGAGFEKISRHH